MHMPFGKHMGQAIEDIPTGYLRWLLTIDLLPHLQYAVQQELSNRKAGAQRQPPPKTPAVIDLAGWYRRLSMRFHPDRGGSKEAMQAINAARELLEEMIR
ncbi:MAG: J domain-containing protein [Pirellulaceae bacterium]